VCILHQDNYDRKFRSALLRIIGLNRLNMEKSRLRIIPESPCRDKYMLNHLCSFCPTPILADPTYWQGSKSYRSPCESRSLSDSYFK